MSEHYDDMVKRPCPCEVCRAEDAALYREQVGLMSHTAKVKRMREALVEARALITTMLASRYYEGERPDGADRILDLIRAAL